MEDTSDEILGTVWRDTTLNLLCVFVILTAIVLPYINPPVEADKMDPPGSIMAAISWPEGNVDVDLWLSGPGEPTPVGYSNKGGLLWNLLRDDLGTVPDYTPLNYEHAFTRGMPPGDYLVNVHCYRCSNFPVEVLLEVTKKSAGAKMALIGTATVSLNRTGEEKTGLAFKLDAEGNVVPGSLNAIYQPLRNSRGK